MKKNSNLLDWVVEALDDLGGQSKIVPICKHIWDHHFRELEEAGDLFYIWQYEMRWAATMLRRDRVLVSAKKSPRGVWKLAKRRGA